MKNIIQEFSRRLLLKIIIVFFLQGVASEANAQVVNNIQVIPLNPVAGDSIYVVSDFSYYGNCSYGLVYIYSYITDSTIHVVPTYCGYGSTTLCNSIDTFSLGVYPAGNYIIDIEYHQGSICPASGFDALIAQFDTSVSIGDASAIDDPESNNLLTCIYPNPSKNLIHIKGNLIASGADIKIMNVLGVVVMQMNSYPGRINIENLEKGIYRILVEQKGKLSAATFIKE